MPTKPGIPELTSATVASPTTVALTWATNVTNETRIEVERRTGSGAWSVVQRTGAVTRATGDATVKPSTAYSYRVRALNDLGAGSYSNALSVRTPAAPPPPPTGGIPGTSARFAADGSSVTVSTAGQSLTFRRPWVPTLSFTANHSWYVARDGSDRNSGAQGSPFATIAHAMELVGPGEAIFLHPGVYGEQVVIAKSGRPDAPIMLACLEGWGQTRIELPESFVRASPSDDRPPVIQIGNGATDVWLNGLIIEGYRGLGLATSKFRDCGVCYQQGAGRGCRVTNCVILHNTHCGVKEMGHRGSGITVEGCVILRNGSNTTDHGIYSACPEWTILGNVIHDHAGYGVHNYKSGDTGAANHQTIARNVLTSNQEGGIIVCGPDNQIAHNTSVENRFGLHLWQPTSVRNAIMNNLFAPNTSDTMRLDIPSEQVQQSHFDANGLLDPGFVDAAAHDCRLRAGSYARGVAVKLPGSPAWAHANLGAFDG